MAIKSGYRHIDTAHMYQNENIVGEAIFESISEGILSSRQDIFVTSKLHSVYHKPELIIPVIKHQLEVSGLIWV